MNKRDCLEPGAYAPCQLADAFGCSMDYLLGMTYTCVTPSVRPQDAMKRPLAWKFIEKIMKSFHRASQTKRKRVAA